MPSTEFLERTVRLIGDEGVERLRSSHVLVAGLGGVGAHAVEALARAGVGRLTLVDFDRVVESNLNRQLLATHLSLGRLKSEVMVERIATIRDDDCCHAVTMRLLPENMVSFFDGLSRPDALIDAIDQFSSKCALIAEGHRRGIPIFSSMGAGRRLDPSKLAIGDIVTTTNCPLAKKIRKQLKEMDIVSGVTAVYSTETPQAQPDDDPTVGSISYMPALFGHMLAGAVIQKLIKGDDE